MSNTVWDQFLAWQSKGKLEEGFEEGASIQIQLSTGETVPAEVRVFKTKDATAEDPDHPVTGLRALINGQSHAKRDTQFFTGRAVDKEHIGGSMLVTLDCSDLTQPSRNALFMQQPGDVSGGPVTSELFKKLQKELRDHEGLIALDVKRYQQKIANATSDDEGINALEDLLSSDPALANLFGSMTQGKVAAKTSTAAVAGTKVSGPAPKFEGTEFPSYFKRSNSSTSVELELPQNDMARVSFLTDVKNNYFSRAKHRGKCVFTGLVEPTFRLFDGRLAYFPRREVQEAGWLQILHRSYDLRCKPRPLEAENKCDCSAASRKDDARAAGSQSEGRCGAQPPRHR